MRHRNRIPLLLATLLLASCVKDPQGERIQPGERLPQFSLATLSGQTVTTDDLLGKPSAVILFTTTCPDCKRQLPEVEAVWELQKDDVNVLAIARDEDRTTVSAYWQSAKYTMPASAPGDRKTYDLFDRGSRSGVPLLFLCDIRGTVVRVADDTETISSNEIISILKTEQP
jgi:peroxiredoxin